MDWLHPEKIAFPNRYDVEDLRLAKEQKGCLTLSSMHALITVSRSEEKNPSGSGKSPLPEYRVLPR